MGMTREKAEAYLERKGELEEEEELPKTKAEVDANNKDVRERNERKIARVMKEGKIYGDPCVEVDF